MNLQINRVLQLPLEIGLHSLGRAHFGSSKLSCVLKMASLNVRFCGSDTGNAGY